MIMACRNLDSGHAARQDILADTSNHGPVPDAGSRLKVMHLDYEDLPTIWCAQLRSCLHAERCAPGVCCAAPACRPFPTDSSTSLVCHMAKHLCNKGLAVQV